MSSDDHRSDVSTQEAYVYRDLPDVPLDCWLILGYSARILMAFAACTDVSYVFTLCLVTLSCLQSPQDTH